MAEQHEKSFNKDTIKEMYREQLFTLTSSINQYLWRTELKAKAETFLTEQRLTADQICEYYNDPQSKTKLAQIEKESGLKKEHWELTLHFLLREDVDNTPNAPLLGPQPFLDKIKLSNYTQEDPLRNVNKFDMINILLRDAFDRARRENATGVPQAGCRYCDNKHDVEFHHIWPHKGFCLVDHHKMLFSPIVPSDQFQAVFEPPFKGPSETWNIVGVCKDHHPTENFFTYQAFPDEAMKVTLSADLSFETVYNLLPHYLTYLQKKQLFDFKILKLHGEQYLSIGNNNIIQYFNEERDVPLPSSELKLIKR